MNTEQTIQQQLATNPIIIYMKGIPSQPECGFSAKAIGILKKINIPFAYVNVLQAPFIREKLPKISKWPTYPQLFVKGELVGGCDIVETMFNDGSLEPLLKSAVPVEDKPDDGSISASEIESRVQQQLPQAQVIVIGTGCDLEVTVISNQFAGLTLVKKQQLVLESLNEPLANGRLHAVSVKTYTEEEWQAQQKRDSSGLLQIKM
jgi:monothiol glutaredoxin